MLSELKHPKARIRFLVAVTVALLVSVAFHFYLTTSAKPTLESACKVAESPPAAILRKPELDSYWAYCGSSQRFLADIGVEVSKGFIAASITSLFFLLLVWLAKQEEDSIHDVSILYQPKQRKVHIDALNTTEYWFHDGHLASWVRRYVIPCFHDKSGRNHAAFRVIAVIMDPQHEQVCQKYLDYVTGLPADEVVIRDLETLRADLCATVCTFFKYYSPGSLELELYLKRDIDFIRDDITESGVFWTTVGKTAPALFIRKRNTESHFYNLSHRNFFAGLLSRDNLNIGAIRSKLGAAVIAANELQGLRTILANALPALSDKLSDEFLRKVQARVELNPNQTNG